MYFQFEFTNGYKIIQKAWNSIEEVPYCFSGSSVKFLCHMAQKSSILTRMEGFQWHCDCFTHSVTIFAATCIVWNFTWHHKDEEVFLPLSPPGWRGIVVTVRAGGRAGGCQTCGTHISVTAWWIFSIRSSVELSRPVGVHCHSHMPICPIWACPWAKKLSTLPQIGSRLCGTHISETAGWIYPI